MMTVLFDIFAVAALILSILGLRKAKITKPKEKKGSGKRLTLEVKDGTLTVGTDTGYSVSIPGENLSEKSLKLEITHSEEGVSVQAGDASVEKGTGKSKNLLL